MSARRYLVNGTTTTVPTSLSSSVIEALVPSGPSYTVIAGVGQANGSFSIPNVPQGMYLLRLDDAYLETSARQLDIVTGALGRSTGTVATVNPTPTQLSVSGLSPWTALDQLVWVAPNFANTFYNFQTFSSSMPTPGSTSSTLTVNFNGSRLVDAAAGDQVWLLQQRSSSDGGVTSGAIVTSSSLAPFTQLNGQTVMVPAPMSTPPTLTQSLAWNLNAFAALQPQLPSGTNPRGLLGFGQVPSTTPLTFTLADLWFSVLPAGAPTPTSATLPVVFPSGWAMMGRTFFVVDTPRTLAGSSGPLALSSGFGHVDQLAAFTGGPITPRLGPVGNITLNGTAFTTDRTGAGSQLTLGWSAPTTGTAVGYYVLLRRLEGPSGSPTTAAETISFAVSGTSFVVPSTVLIPGQPYVFELQAVNGNFPARTQYGTVEAPLSFSFVVTPIVRL